MQKKVALLTGGTGYLGRFTACALVQAGFRVVNLTRSGSDLSVLSSDPMTSSVENLEVDTDFSALPGLVVELRPDAIVHLASISRGAETAETLRGMVSANVLLPTLLGAAAVECGCPRFVHCGTSWQTSGVDARYRPFNAYAGTKQAAESVLAGFGPRGLSTISLRMFDIYGPADPRRKIVDLIFDALDSDTALKMSPGGQKMDMVYVSDAAAALVHAATMPMDEFKTVGVTEYAVTSGEPVALRDIAGAIEEVSGRTPAIDWGGRPYRDGEIMVPNAAIPPLPGWRAEVGLEEGLQRVWSARGAI